MPITTISVCELKSQAAQIIQMIQEKMAEYVITVHGEPVAIIRPFTKADAQQISQTELDQAMADMKALAQEVAAAWTSPQTGVELVEERRT